MTPISREAHLITGGWTDLREHAQLIRLRVFVDEQGIDPALELDAMDEHCIHCVAFVDGQALGCGRLLPDGHIGRMAVLSSVRRLGLGGQILQRLISVARERGDRRVELSAQAYVEMFYLRHGFQREGAVYFEAGMEHVAMWRDL